VDVLDLTRRQRAQDVVGEIRRPQLVVRLRKDPRDV
jgi:hypothetical protein